MEDWRGRTLIREEFAKPSLIEIAAFLESGKLSANDMAEFMGERQPVGSDPDNLTDLKGRKQT